MVITLTQSWATKSQHWCKSHGITQRRATIFAILAVLIFTYFNPKTVADAWLTPDQQGYLLFSAKKYGLAASTFQDAKWQAFSYYGAENYDAAASIYDQFSDKNSQLARANAMAQGRRYVQAKQVYEAILFKSPDFQPAKHNLAIVQKIIDDVNRMSESQQAEKGDSTKELGDEPQTGDGAEKKEARPVAVEQLTAQELMSNPEITELWLKQVQKDPALFLSQKFYIQQANASQGQNKQESNNESK